MRFFVMFVTAVCVLFLCCSFQNFPRAFLLVYMTGWCLASVHYTAQHFQSNYTKFGETLSAVVYTFYLTLLEDYIFAYFTRTQCCMHYLYLISLHD